MTVHLVTFSDDSMSRSAELCMESAKRYGVEDVNRYHPPDVPECASLMEKWPRGRGYWSWKPEIIGAEMRMRCVDGDILIYSDAGIEFIDNVNHIIDRMDQDIFLFGNQWEHAHWCKRDIVDAIWPYDVGRDGPFVMDDLARSDEQWERYYQDAALLNPWHRFGKQVQASVIFFRVNDKTRAFVKEWLDWCLFEGGRLIDDSPSRTPNHPEFQENRHDQAILTTMAYRDGYKLHWWPAMYNDGAFVYERGDYPDEGIPVTFHHHRRRNHEWSSAA